MAQRDLVGVADDDRTGSADVGQRHEPVGDDQAARQHAVVRDELRDEVGERRARPGDPAAALDEPALALARQQRLAVVQREDELDLLAQRLDRVEQAKADPARPGRQRRPGEHAVDDHARAARRELRGDAERQGAGVSTGAPSVTRLARPAPRR